MAQLEAALRASAEAINELRESLDEQCLSEIAVEGSVARFWVRAEDGSETRFTATFSGSSLPAPCVLEVAGGAAARGLARANTRLAGGASLAKAVTGAGRAVGVDLDWTAEAEGDGEFSGLGRWTGLSRAGCTAAAPPRPGATAADRPWLQLKPPAGNGSDEEMVDAGSHGGDSDEDGDDDELLREWSKRLVKWVLQGREAGGNATAPVCCGPALGMHICPMLSSETPVMLAFNLFRMPSAFRRVEKIERGLEEREAEAEAEGNLDALQQRQVGASLDGAARIMLTAAPVCMCMWAR